MYALLACIVYHIGHKGGKSPGTGVMGDCELPGVNAGNQAQVLRKSSKGL